MRARIIFQFSIACAVALVSNSSSQLQASVIITYEDVGSNLQFDYSGSLNISSGTSFLGPLKALALQASGTSPIFYSSDSYGFAGTDTSVTHTPGPFATNLPLEGNYNQGTMSGTSFMFRLNGGNPGPAPSLNLWGNWGAANTLFSGQLILTGQSAAGIGMVNGWNVETDWGSITFQAANTAVPEPASLTLLSLGAIGLAGAARRRRQTA